MEKEGRILELDFGREKIKFDIVLKVKEIQNFPKFFN